MSSIDGNTKAPTTYGAEPTPSLREDENSEETASTGVAAAAVRPTPSPNQDAPPISSSSTSMPSERKNSIMDSSARSLPGETDQDDEPDDDATQKKSFATKHSSASFFATPSPFYPANLKPLAKEPDASNESPGIIPVKTENYEEPYMQLSPKDYRVSLPHTDSATMSSPSAEMSFSNFSFTRSGSSEVLQDAFLGTPCPDITPRVSAEFISFEPEVPGSMTAPPLDNDPPFEADAEPSDYPLFTAGMDSVHVGGVDTTQYDIIDQFPLPPTFQAHLDETYAASTYAYLQNPEERDGRTSNLLFQVTAYRPKVSAPGSTPPSISRSSRFGDCNGKENDEPAPGNFAKRRANTASSYRSKTAKNKARPLPLRKRPLELNIDSPTQPVRSSARITNNQGNEDYQGNRTERKGRVTCRCVKSRCLKLYCECFMESKFCCARCQCENCGNNEANSTPNGARTIAIREILERRPDAFEPREHRAREGCNCKKNKCLKKYCECFRAGIKCNRNYCRCTNCKNKTGNGRDSFHEEAEVKRTPTTTGTPVQKKPAAVLQNRTKLKRGKVTSQAGPDCAAAYEPRHEKESEISRMTTYNLRVGSDIKYNAPVYDQIIGMGTPSPSMKQRACRVEQV
mmetsp:Transcript_4969/g.10214  ORF Transcript_4969/g.10214 Transcript_4969/m.10214 type:complete len:627 (-) Transcript_4969:21-1901(-)